jgi:molybdate transport system regulatory protein
MNARKKVFSDLCLKHKIWIETTDGKSILGDGKWQLLKAIEAEGSLMGAVKKLGLSYRKTWDNLKRIEQDLGVSLLEKSSGGVHGGSSVMTVEGKKLVRAFDNYHSKMDVIINTAFQEFINEINS